eukprot:scaffold15622_cov121-Isochrysis_galbana.AAC.2
MEMEKTADATGGHTLSGEAELILLEEVVRAHAETARMLVVVLGPSECHVVMVLFEVQLEKDRVEVGQIVVDPLLTQSIIDTDLLRSSAAAASRIGSERHESPGRYLRASPTALRVGVSYRPIFSYV